MARTPRSLTGKVAVVTGGGRGIGAATARALMAHGARVAIGDLDPSSAPEGALALPLDVTDRPGFTAFLDEVERRLGAIDVVVNNAGIMPVVRADEEADATVIRQIEINLHGVIHGTAEAMRRMKPRGTGHIVNIASAAGKTGIPGLATYCATKHGVVGYSEAVRGELRGTGVEVTVVMPSLVATELTSGIKDAQVRALGKLDTAVEVGGFVGIGQTGVITSDYDNLSFRVAYLTDVGGAHGSHIITPSIEYGTPLSRQAYVGLSLSADIVGEGYADYYFSVAPAGSLASGLAAYDADGGFKSWSLSLAGAHALTGDLLGGVSLFAVGSYTRLRGDFAESPIVSTAGSANQWFAAVGLSYSF